MSAKPTAQIAPSAAPAHAILIWCDLSRIYIQLPSINGPCVLDYTRDAKGLGNVLDLMRSRHQTETAGAPYAKPPWTKQDPRFTPVQRETVRELLRRKGIVGR